MQECCQIRQPHADDDGDQAVSIKKPVSELGHRAAQPDAGLADNIAGPFNSTWRLTVSSFKTAMTARIMNIGLQELHCTCIAAGPMSAKLMLLSRVAWHFASQSLNFFSRFRSPAAEEKLLHGCASASEEQI